MIIYYLLCVAMVCTGPIVVSGEDLAYTEGSTGRLVVLRCIDLITDSQIFPYDQEMLRRIAYATTEYGEIQDDSSSSIGMWKILPIAFNKLSTQEYNMTEYYSVIESRLNVQWEGVSQTNLSIPIVSALAARLLLAYAQQQRNNSLPSAAGEQYAIWNHYFDENENSVTYQEFTDRIAAIPSVILCPAEYRDIIFLIDSSLEINDDEFDFVKQFLSSIVGHFNISTTLTRIGIIQYAVQQKVSLKLIDGISESVVISSITNLALLSETSIQTGFAINRAISLFETEGRTTASGIARVLVVVTHALSEDNVALPSYDAADENINIIAVGVGDPSLQNELSEIVNGSRNALSFLETNYSDLPSIANTVEERVCEEVAGIDVDSVVTGTLDVGQSQTYAISMTNISSSVSLSLSTSSGEVSGYLSNTFRNPSSVAFDISITSGTSDYTYQTNNEAIFYATIECSSSVAAIYSFTIGDPPSSTDVIETIPISAVSTTQQLSGGEIAGIVLACLIFVCGILIAFAYYCFRKKPVSGATLLVEEKMNFWSTTVVNSEKVAEDVSNIPSNPVVQSLPSVDSSADVPYAKEISQEKIVRAQLRSAIETSDVVAAASAISTFYELGLADVDGDLIRGERLVQLQECKQGLSYAMSKRDIKTLEQAIFKAKQNNFGHELKNDLMQSEVLLRSLKSIQNLMDQLNHALKKNDMALVEKITFEIRAKHGFDQATVERMLDIHSCREDLNLSMVNRDLILATSTLDKVEHKGYEPDLRTEVKKTKKMKKELEYLEKVRQDVLNLNQSRVSEIRSYMNPPHGVCEVMTAVYLILGYTSTDIMTWNNIQGLMGKTGKESLKNQIKGIDPRKVSIEQVQLAKSFISSYDVNEIQSISLGLALFYIFVVSVIEEVEKIEAGILSAPTPFTPELYR